jgi:peptidoglycan/LPS O-acetylase OafA/YrhL
VLLWRMKRNWLAVLVVLAAIGLGISAFTGSGVVLGYNWGQMIHALARIGFSFGAGLLLFRFGVAIRSRLGFATLSLIMLLVFVGPFGSPLYGSHAPFNWIYELAIVLFIFPMMVALGAGAQSSGLMRSLCTLSGRISYPIYMVHYAFVMVFFNYHWTRTIGPEKLPWVIAASTISIVLISYGILVFYDEPLRRWLNRQHMKCKRSTGHRFATGS